MADASAAPVRADSSSDSDRAQHHRQSHPLQHHEIDAAIPLGAGKWSGMSSGFLFAHVIEPVCSPSWLPNSPPLDPSTT
jgi:hypothetical protein